MVDLRRLEISHCSQHITAAKEEKIRAKLGMKPKHILKTEFSRLHINKDSMSTI